MNGIYPELGDAAASIFSPISSLFFVIFFWRAFMQSVLALHVHTLQRGIWCSAVKTALESIPCLLLLTNPFAEHAVPILFIKSKHQVVTMLLPWISPLCLSWQNGWPQSSVQRREPCFFKSVASLQLCEAISSLRWLWLSASPPGVQLRKVSGRHHQVRAWKWLWPSLYLDLLHSFPRIKACHLRTHANLSSSYEP